MTSLPDPIDAAEARFARRVRDYTEPAVVPVDHAAMASAAVGGGGPRRRDPGRLGWLLAGAAALAGIAAVAILVNAWRGPEVGASPSAPSTVSSSAAPSPGTSACLAAGLEASVGPWEGAAGHRISTLTVSNTSASACSLPSTIQPSLIDRNGRALIVGKVATLTPVVIAAGGSVGTLVQTGNYCGPTAQEPAAVRLDLGAGGTLVAKPAAGDTSSGVPPCMGEVGPTDDITIRDWGAPQG